VSFDVTPKPLFGSEWSRIKIMVFYNDKKQIITGKTIKTKYNIR